MGEYLKITGGRPLFGQAVVPAAKNSVLPLIAASMLCRGETLLRQAPALADVEQSLAIYTALGGQVQRQGQAVRLRADGAQGRGILPDGPARSMRSSVFYLAPALHRFGRVQMPMPGGCKLGPRPIDIHLEGLSRMGAQTQWEDGQLVLTAPRGLHGVDYALRLPSVGATETLLMAAVLAKGETVLRGAAREPEIVDLAEYLCACGASVQGAGSPVIRVQGRPELQGTAYTPIPDRIYAATLAAAVASAGGQVRIQGCPAEFLEPVLAVLELAGCGVQRLDRAFLVERSRTLKGVGRVYTGVYPAFCTDAAPVVAAALLCAAGRSAVEDTVFENRFACTAGFADMGAQACRAGRAVEITGVRRLTGTSVEGSDLRGTAALVVAALAASGESRVSGLEHLRRGYLGLPATLQSLGAKVQLAVQEAGE